MGLIGEGGHQLKKSLAGVGQISDLPWVFIVFRDPKGHHDSLLKNMYPSSGALVQAREGGLPIRRRLTTCPTHLCRAAENLQRTGEI